LPQGDIDLDALRYYANAEVTVGGVAALVARTGNIYAGLAYPTAIAFMTFIVGSIVLPETGQRKIWDEV